MVLGVADDGYANAEAGGDSTLGDGVGSVVGAFGVDVGAQIFEELLDVGLRENHNVIDVAERGDQKSAGVFVKNGAAWTFERANAGIGIDRDDEDLSFGFCGGEIAGMTDVESIKYAVREDDGRSTKLGCFHKGAEFFAGDNF